MPTYATAEGGMLLFGDKEGYLIMSERSFQDTDRKHKLFRGAVKGISYMYDPMNISKQYVIILGDDSQPQFSESKTEKYQPLYFVKVGKWSLIYQPASDDFLISYFIYF